MRWSMVSQPLAPISCPAADFNSSMSVMMRAGIACSSKSGRGLARPAARLLAQKRHGLHARDVEPLAAAQIFARHFVIEQHHVAQGFLKARAVALIGPGRDT